jgi:hypothetical protein
VRRIHHPESTFYIVYADEEILHNPGAGERRKYRSGGEKKSWREKSKEIKISTNKSRGDQQKNQMVKRMTAFA